MFATPGPLPRGTTLLTGRCNIWQLLFGILDLCVLINSPFLCCKLISISLRSAAGLYGLNLVCCISHKYKTSEIYFVGLDLRLLSPSTDGSMSVQCHFLSARTAVSPRRSDEDPSSFFLLAYQTRTAADADAPLVIIMERGRDRI